MVVAEIWKGISLAIGNGRWSPRLVVQVVFQLLQNGRRPVWTYRGEHREPM